MKLHGYIGLASMAATEALLFSGNVLVGRWLTPIVWTGYVILADALVYKLRGRSLFVSDRRELLVVAAVSITAWWLYHNLEPNPYLRRVGYDWAFATIFPALFLTAELFNATLFRRWLELRPVRLTKPVLFLLILVGAFGAIIPFVVISEWLVPVVWLSLIFLLDPVNSFRGWPSITGDLARGDLRRLFSLLAAGGVCGVLWEFWNYWAVTRWTYRVPYLGNVKLFEMPVL